MNELLWYKKGCITLLALFESENKEQDMKINPEKNF